MVRDHRRAHARRLRIFALCLVWFRIQSARSRLKNMCRLYGFRGNEPTKVECSLVYAQNALLAQSTGDERGEAHLDGWGIAVYEDGWPEVERRDTAAH